ncbi:MAG: hypothetical protein KDD33_07495 [Bdellovibrionales bacterium]|nr:hypothetical protein [Bdellovibrionales bacterium]
MSQKKNQTIKLKSTLNELDSAIDQWNSLTNKPTREQACKDNEFQKRAKTLLKQLREQLEEFDPENPPQ